DDTTRPLAWRLATDCTARVAQAKSSASRAWPDPTGSRTWASNPAEIRMRSGAKASTGSIRLSKADRQTSRGAPTGETALTTLAGTAPAGRPPPGHTGPLRIEAKR